MRVEPPRRVASDGSAEGLAHPLCHRHRPGEAGLGLPDVDHAALEVHVAGLQVQQFPRADTSVDQDNHRVSLFVLAPLAQVVEHEVFLGVGQETDAPDRLLAARELRLGPHPAPVERDREHLRHWRELAVDGAVAVALLAEAWSCPGKVEGLLIT